MDSKNQSNLDNSIIQITFRRIVKDIPSTNYATHGIYSHPARFIPHVVRFAIKNFSKKGDWVFDPFGGFGTVAIESSLLGRNYVIWDLNPMLEIFVKASTYTDNLMLEDLSVDWDFTKRFIPDWNNIYYWHPKRFVKRLSRAWGYYHYSIKKRRPDIAPIVAIPLLKITKYFSYADLQIYKLYKSKKAKKRIAKLLRSKWLKKMRSMHIRFAQYTFSRIVEYRNMNPQPVEGIIKGGVSALEENLNFKVDLLLTSPPYLQAHEYIRSFKLELFWLGYTQELIRMLQRKEIPYNHTLDVTIHSKTYHKYRDKIIKREGKESRLLRVYENYFKSLIIFFQKNIDYVRKYICIFIGPAKIRNIRIPIEIILKEELEHLGWTHYKTYVDKIYRRRIFKTRKNPATNLPDERIPIEYLLVLKRK